MSSSSFLKRARKKALSTAGKRLSKCQDVTLLMSDSFERKLSLRERISMRMHMLVCGACRNYLSNLKVMREIFEEPLLSTSHGDERLKDESRSRIAKNLRAIESDD